MLYHAKLEQLIFFASLRGISSRGAHARQSILDFPRTRRNTGNIDADGRVPKMAESVQALPLFEINVRNDLAELGKNLLNHIAGDIG